MGEPRKRMSREEFLAFIQSIPKEKLTEMAQKARVAHRKEAEVKCEEVFNKLDLLLPAHITSRTAMLNLMARLRPAKPDPSTHA